MGPLSPDTPLARFAADRVVRPTKMPRIRDSFMMPRWDTGVDGWALSTSRVDGMAADEKRDFGAVWVRENLGEARSLKAHCEIPVRSVESAGGRALRAVFDDTPPRHVNVTGWPEQEDAQLEIAQELCALVETTGHVARY